MTFSYKSNLLPIKGHFFLLFGGMSPVVLFMATFAKQLGFSAVLVGSVFSILPFLSMAGKLLMGAFADRFQCHKSLIIIFLIIMLATSLTLNFITPINKRVEADLICNDNSVVRLCSEGEVEKCFASKMKSEFNENLTINCNMECLVDDQFIESVCETWNSSQYCEKPFNEDQKIPSAEMEIIKINYSDVTSMNRVLENMSNATFHEEKLTLLRFDADLLPHHEKQEASCLSMGIGRILSPDNQESLYMPYCNTQKEFPCQIVCDNSIITNIGKVVDEKSTMSYNQFWLFIIISAVGSISMGTVNCLGETICFGLLGDQPSEFGKQRLWGSVGWGIMSLVGGILVDYFSDGKATKNYTPIFYTSAAIIGLDIIIASRIKDTKRDISSSIIWDIGKLFKDVKVLIYIVWCICMGMSNGIVMNFLFWHLEDLSNCDGLEKIKTLEGLYVTLEAFCGEIPFFFLNGWVLNKIGHINSMSLSLFTFGMIFVLFSVLDNPLYFLPLSFLNGIAFSTMYATMTSYASIIAPPGTEATMQGVVGSVYDGIGISFGSFIAGLLMHYLKGARFFLLYGITTLIICILHICIQFFLQKSQKISPAASNGTRKSVQYTSPENAIQIFNENKY